MFQAGGMLAAAVLIFLIYGIVFLAGCCCPARQVATTKRCICCFPRLGYVISSLMLIAALGPGLAYIMHFDTGFESLANGLTSMKNLLVTSSATVSGPLLTSAVVLNVTAADMAAAAAGTSAQADANSLAAAASSAVSTAVSLAAMLNGTVASIIEGFDIENSASSVIDGAVSKGNDGAFKVEIGSIRYGFTYATVSLLATVLGWMVITFILLMPNKCSERLFKGFSVITLGGGTLIVLCAALLYVPAIMGSDICMAPTTSINNILNQTGADGTAVDTWNYYTQCGGNPALAPIGAYGQAVNSVAEIQSAMVSLSAVNATINADPNNPNYQPLKPYLTVLSSQLQDVNATMNTLVSGISCAPVSSIWYTMEDGLCNGAIVAVIMVFLCLAAASFIILFLLSFTACLITRHHVDREAKAGDVYTSASSAQQQMVYMPTGQPAQGRAARVAQQQQVVAVPIHQAGSAAAYGDYSTPAKGKGREWR